jgi:5,10-methenyltetrahydrofolate synthetase
MQKKEPTTQPDPERADLRARLLAARAALADREVRERALAARVARWLRTIPVARLAFYWPVRGEPDLTQVIGEWLAAGAGRTAALPVVAGEALEFAAWTPGAPMQPGAYGIPVPATIRRVVPQLILIPCVGIDDQRYRLGYGGGYYDRTAAAFAVRPVLVGVGFDCGRIASIDPQPHDVRLDLAITESGVL